MRRRAKTLARCPVEGEKETEAEVGGEDCGRDYLCAHGLREKLGVRRAWLSLAEPRRRERARKREREAQKQVKTRVRGRKTCGVSRGEVARVHFEKSSRQFRAVL